MSYKKAMKHASNVRKCRKQARNYMGFDAGSGSWPNARRNPLTAREIEVCEWYKQRHRGDKQYARECIREAVADVRAMRQQRQAWSAVLRGLQKVDVAQTWQVALVHLIGEP